LIIKLQTLAWLKQIFQLRQCDSSSCISPTAFGVKQSPKIIHTCTRLPSIDFTDINVNGNVFQPIMIIFRPSSAIKCENITILFKYELSIYISILIVNVFRAIDIHRQVLLPKNCTTYFTYQLTHI